MLHMAAEAEGRLDLLLRQYLKLRPKRQRSCSRSFAKVTRNACSCGRQRDGPTTLVADTERIRLLRVGRLRKRWRGFPEGTNKTRDRQFAARDRSVFESALDHRHMLDK